MFKTTLVLLVLLRGATILMAAPTPTLVQYGHTVLGSIDGCNNSGQVNTYSFEGSKGDAVLVEVTKTADFGGICNGVGICAFDQYVEIDDASGSPISSAASPKTSGCSSQLRTQDGPFVLPHDGTYTIDSSEKSVGEFRLGQLAK